MIILFVILIHLRNKLNFIFIDSLMSTALPFNIIYSDCWTPLCLVLEFIATMYYFLMTLQNFCGHFLFLINLKSLLINLSVKLNIYHVTMVRNLLMVLFNNFMIIMRFIFVSLFHIRFLKMRKLKVRFVLLIIFFVLSLIISLFPSLFGHIPFK